MALTSTDTVPVNPTGRPRCAICSSDQGQTLVAQERMFGYGDQFPYFECGACGCVQALQPPTDMSRYYPPHYYSFTLPPPQHYRIGGSRLVRWMRKKQTEAYLFNKKNMWSRLSHYRPPYIPHAGHRHLLEKCPHLNLCAKVLDIGCGRGHFLVELASLGFRTLHGVDPYITDTTSPIEPIRLYKCPLDYLPHRDYELVFMHHSLEHIKDQHATMRAIWAILSNDGVCIIRIPIAGSRPWRIYKDRWVELDAPRHYFLHTVGSFRRLATDCGFTISAVGYDGDALAYWGSELYSVDTSLYDGVTLRDPRDSFAPDQMAEFEHQASADNENGEAGRAIFWLRKTFREGSDQGNHRPS